MYEKAIEVYSEVLTASLNIFNYSHIRTTNCHPKSGKLIPLCQWLRMKGRYRSSYSPKLFHPPPKHIIGFLSASFFIFFGGVKYGNERRNA